MLPNLFLDTHTLHIPAGARVTLNMNGHMFDRGCTGKEKRTKVTVK